MPTNRKVTKMWYSQNRTCRTGRASPVECYSSQKYSHVMVYRAWPIPLAHRNLYQKKQNKRSSRYISSMWLVHSFSRAHVLVVSAEEAAIILLLVQIG